MSCLDNSKSHTYDHIAGEDRRCYIELDSPIIYVCYFGQWTIPVPASESEQRLFIIDQLYCSNSDYEGSFTN